MSTDLVQHWHGIFQKTTNWADGGAFVNQCPIVPSHNFTYTFDTTEQAVLLSTYLTHMVKLITLPLLQGTYWYHSHYEAQYCDGLRGPLVVYDPLDPHRDLYDIDDSETDTRY